MLDADLLTGDFDIGELTDERVEAFRQRDSAPGSGAGRAPSGQVFSVKSEYRPNLEFEHAIRPAPAFLPSA